MISVCYRGCLHLTLLAWGNAIASEVTVVDFKFKFHNILYLCFKNC